MKKVMIGLAMTLLAGPCVQAQARHCRCVKKETCRMSYCRQVITCHTPEFTPNPAISGNGEPYVYCGGNHCGGGCDTHKSWCCGKEGRVCRKEVDDDIMIMHYKPEKVIHYKVCRDEDGQLTCCRY